MLKQYRAREETTLGIVGVNLLRVEIMSNSKGKKKVEDEES